MRPLFSEDLIVEKIKIGIYGLGKISHRVIQGIQCSKNSELYAVCSRSQIKASEFQKNIKLKEHIPLMKKC